jgi:molybdate transport system substrate-binding protein
LCPLKSAADAGKPRHADVIPSARRQAGGLTSGPARRFGLALVLSAGLPAIVLAQKTETIAVAAASDLVFCLEDLHARFQQANPRVSIMFTSGSSGNFFAQIQRGAPFDTFLSADMRFPRELAKSGQAVESSLTRYAVGRVVLWTTRSNIVVTNGLSVLTNAAVRRIAIANPDHAPYGRAAKAALEHEKLWDPVKDKLVLGENIAQTAQYVQSGNADVGLVALSLVSAPKLRNTGAWWLIPDGWHPALDQGAVLTTRGRDNPAARAYLEFLRSKEAREVFERHGFRLPDNP